jgi:hypothetical protein
VLEHLQQRHRGDVDHLRGVNYRRIRRRRAATLLRLWEREACLDPVSRFCLELVQRLFQARKLEVRKLVPGRVAGSCPSQRQRSVVEAGEGVLREWRGVNLRALAASPATMALAGGNYSKQHASEQRQHEGLRINIA